MTCANPDCPRTDHDLFQGTLWSLEREASSDERTMGSDGGFPTCSVPTRFFWLCGHCSKRLVIRRWTAEGLVFGAIPAAPATGRKLAPGSEELDAGQSASASPNGFMRRA